VKLSEITVEAAKVTTVQIKTSGAAKYRAELIDSPTRLVIDLQDTVYVTPKTPVAVSGDPIKQIRVSQFKKNVARVVIELSRKVDYKIVATSTGLSVVVNAPSAVAAKPAAPSPGAPAAKAEAAKPQAPKAEAAKPPATKPEAPKPPAVKAEAPKPPAAKPPAAPGAAAVAKPGVAKAEKPAPAETEKATVAKKPVAAAPKPKKPAEPKLEVAKVETPPAGEVAQAQPPAPVPAPAPAPAPLPPANGARLISFDFKDADVVNLLRILAAESGKNIVIGDDVKGKMSITLNNVPWQVALDTILEARGLQKIERDNLIRIVSNEQLAREREAAARVQEAKLKADADVRQKIAEARKAEQAADASDQARREAQARGPLREETIRLSYADPDEVAKTLQGILGIPPGGIQASPLTPAAGPPPIAEPPFSQLYGTGPTQQPRPAATPSAEVLSRGITIQANKPTNSIFIRHYERDLERIKKLIHETLDIPLPQVKIEARLESLNRFALENLGVQWGGAWAGAVRDAQLVGQGLTSNVTAGGAGLAPAPSSGIGVSTGAVKTVGGNPNLTLGSLLPLAAATGLPTGGSLINLPISTLPRTGGIDPAPTAGFSFGIISTRFNINLALQALAEQQKTRTIARPEIVTVENNRAMIQLGSEIPYATVSSAGTSVQFKDAVIQLQVTPVVIREGDITKVKMTVLVEQNSQGADTTYGPAIDKRRAETQVLVKDGEHLVIGGVGQSTESKAVRKVPLVGDIPVLGWLFKQRGDRESSTELVVFITPSVLKQEPPAVQPTPAK
jgi:type IV pilus assembly protein PilQ